MMIKRESVEMNKPISPINPVEPNDAPTKIVVSRKRPRWEQQTPQDVQGHEAPHGTFQERKIPLRFSSYVALMSHIIDSEPTTYEEASRNQVWRDSMME